MTAQTGKKSATRRQHALEYRTEALVAMAEKVGVSRATKELRLHESPLYSWRAKARSAQDRSEIEQQQAAEIACRIRQLTEQAEELAIVKKTVTYFAKGLE